MTPDDFNRAFEYVVQNEGYYVNGPADRGGPTKYGITITTLAAWRGVQVSPEDVQTMTRDEAQAIYQKKYWNALQCPSLTSLAIATALFDMGVLFGVNRASLYSQMALTNNGYQVTMDGKPGPETNEALNAVDVGTFLDSFTELFQSRVLELVKELPDQTKFKNGWLNRINRILTLKP